MVPFCIIIIKYNKIAAVVCCCGLLPVLALKREKVWSRGYKQSWMFDSEHYVDFFQYTPHIRSRFLVSRKHFLSDVCGVLKLRCLSTQEIFLLHCRNQARLSEQIHFYSIQYNCPCRFTHTTHAWMQLKWMLNFCLLLCNDSNCALGCECWRSTQHECEDTHALLTCCFQCT